MTATILNHVIGHYRCGSLFRKLKKTWLELDLIKKENTNGLDFVEMERLLWDNNGPSDEDQNFMLLPSELNCFHVCFKFLKKTIKEKSQTNPRSCSRTLVIVNEAHNDLHGKYSPGSLLRKLKTKWFQLARLSDYKHIVFMNDLDLVELEKTWLQLGQNYEEHSTIVLEIEKECLYKCLDIFNENKDIIKFNENKSTSLGFSGTSVAVNEDCYNSGSLLKKLTKTCLQLCLDEKEETVIDGLDYLYLKRAWDQIGLSDKEQSSRLLKIETKYLKMYMEFFFKKKLLTNPRRGFTVTSLPINEDPDHCIGEYSCGSLLRKLKKTCVQLDANHDADFVELKNKCEQYAQSYDQQIKLLTSIEIQCVRRCSKFFKNELVKVIARETNLRRYLYAVKLEISTLSSALGEKMPAGIPDNTVRTIKDLVEDKSKTLKDLRKKKKARHTEYSLVLLQILKISDEIAGFLKRNDDNEDDVPPKFDDYILSQNKLEEYRTWLQKLQNKKNERLEKVSGFVNTVCDLCAVLGMDSSSILAEVHPSLNDFTDAQPKSISIPTLDKLDGKVLMLKEEKKQRLHKFKKLASQLNRLWNQTDTPREERNLVDNVTYTISASVDEVITPNALALDLIKQAEVEVERLEQLKRVKEEENSERYIQMLL